MSMDPGNSRKEVRKPLDPKGNNANKEMDTGKKTIKRCNAPHLRAGSNTGSLRTPKNTPNINEVERSWSAVKSLPSRKYDIDTLMAIGKNGGTDSIIAKFSYQSVENNLVRRSTSSGERVLAEKRTSHIRGASRGSVGNEDEHSSTQESNLKHPSRQPRNAPQGRLAQANAGFARFLKEHASPKHQRVTAGGRIVPMGSVLPAPEFNLSGKITEQGDRNSTRKTSTVGLSSDSSSFGCFSNDTRQATHPEPPYDAQNKSAQGQASSAETSGQVQTTSAPNMANFSAQHQIPSFVQIPNGQMNMIPVSLLQGHMPSGTTLVGTQGTSILPNYTTGLPTTSTFNGNGEQGLPTDQSQNQQFLTPQYLPIFAQQPIQGMFSPQVGGITGMFQPVPNLQMPISPSLYQVTNIGGGPQSMPQVQMANAAHSIPNYQQNPALSSVLLEVTREYESLTEQLSNLDRYLALHTWAIDPATKRALVDQRKELVIKIDSTRTSKELLESTMKTSKTEVPARAQNDPGQYFPITQSQAQGDEASSAASFQAAFWNPNTTLHHGSQGYVPDNVTNTPMPTNPYSSSTFVPGVPAQSPMPEQPHYEPASAEYEVHQLFDNPAYGNIWVQDWAQAPNSIGRSFNQHGHRTSMASVPAIAMEADDWSTPKRPAPPEISRIYSKIEEAANRGANIEKILEDLALVTARLSEARHDQETIERSGMKPQQGHFDYRSEGPVQVRPPSECNQTGGQAPMRSYDSLQTSTHRPATRKEGSRAIPITKPKETSSSGAADVGDDDDNDGSSSYSDESTNSWATIEVGDKRWLAREKLKADNPQTPGDVSSKKRQGKGSVIREKSVSMPDVGRHIANTAGRDGDPSGNIVANVKPKASGASKTESMRQTAEWVESGDNCRGEQHVHDQSPGQYDQPQNQDSNARAKGSPEKARSRNKNTNRRSDIFSLGPWGRSSESSQKVGTSTSFQDVNVHAFLPPFDGPGDTRQGGSSATGTTTPKDDRNHEASKGRAEQPPQRWYLKPDREAPSPAEVHKFFRSIEEEERIMIEKYRNRHPV